jgi:hypothetical protein
VFVSRLSTLSSLLQEARESMAASIAKASLLIFIVFISIFVVNVSVYINAVKQEILHRRAPNFLNRRA